MRDNQTDYRLIQEAPVKQSQRSSMISTEDAHLQSQSFINSKFACDMIAVNKCVSIQEKCELTCKQIYNLFLHNQSNFQKILTIQGLKYVTTDTKAQFTFLIMFYYLLWLSEMQAFIHKKDSLLSKRYKDINCDYISIDSLHKLELYLRTQSERVSDGFFKCSQRVHATLHLISSQKKYLPRDFQKHVSNAALSHCLDFSKCKMQELAHNAQEFFIKRIKKEYDYTRQNESDDKITVIESISSSFI